MPVSVLQFVLRHHDDKVIVCTPMPNVHCYLIKVIDIDKSTWFVLYSLLELHISVIVVCLCVRMVGLAEAGCLCIKVI